MPNTELRIVILSALALFFAGAFTAMLLVVLRSRRQWSAWAIAAGVLSTCGGMWFIHPQVADVMLLLICAWGIPVMIAYQVIVDRDAADRARQVEKGLEILREEHRA